ncbi:hypothetical protein ABID58_005438 [Bradyrhizobium sp. S3.2.6]|uniref:hypothetical protein n=1 Tax=Bradyrhizobium sp. S3.2.6 TaxID=3156428 RepID=UPI00339A2453
MAGLACLKIGMQVAGIVLVMAWSDPANAEPSQYVCTAEHAAGLHFDRQAGTWGVKEFGASKYNLRRLTEGDRDKSKSKYWPLLERHPKANWAFFKIGGDQEMPLVACFEDKADKVLSNLFRCEPIVHDARFDKDTRRFEVIVSGGYVDQGFWEQYRRENPGNTVAQDPSRPDDLFIEIGTCSPS